MPFFRSWFRIKRQSRLVKACCRAPCSGRHRARGFHRCDVCGISPNGQESLLNAEVVGFREGKVLLMPLESIQGLGSGCKITSLGRKASIAVGRELLGRVIDGLGNPIDNRGPIRSEDEYPLYADPINPLQRGRIKAPMDLGIRALNALLT